MSKRIANQKAAAGSKAKKARAAARPMPTLADLALSNLDLGQLESSLELKIEKADYAGSRELVATLKALLQKAKQHEKKVKPEGLSYKDKKKGDMTMVKCKAKCGNSVHYDDDKYCRYCVHCCDYTDACDGFCSFCVTKKCRCGRGVCDKCFEKVESCQRCRKGPLCFECADQCDSCEKWFCSEQAWSMLESGEGLDGCNYVGSNGLCENCENL